MSMMAETSSLVRLVATTPLTERFAGHFAGNITYHPDLARRRRTSLSFGDASYCEDVPADQDTGFKLSGQQATCPMLKLHCFNDDHGCGISFTCPVTCEACNDCDLVDTGITFVSSGVNHRVHARACAVTASCGLTHCHRVACILQCCLRCPIAPVPSLTRAGESATCAQLAPQCQTPMNKGIVQPRCAPRASRGEE